MAPSVALPMDIVEPPDPADEDGYAEWLMKLHDWWDADDDDFIELEFSPGHHLPGAGNESLTAIPDSPTSPHAHQAALLSPGPRFTGSGSELLTATSDLPTPQQAPPYPVAALVSPGPHLSRPGTEHPPITPERPTATSDLPTPQHAPPYPMAALVSPGPHLSRAGTEHPPITPERPSPPQAHSYHPESPSHLSRGREIFAFIGGKETLGGLERWFSPRGQDLAFLLSRIGLIRPRSVLI
jgi:hypothetical protein